MAQTHQTYTTSTTFPEKEIDPTRWGSNPQLGIPPHQVVLAPSHLTKSHVYKLDYYAGLKNSTMHYLNKRLKYNIFYYPNPCITEFQKSSHGHGRKLLNGKALIAVIRCCFVDIDDPNLTVSQALKSSPIKPQAIINSGNGLHLYYGVKPISLISLYGKFELERERLISTFKKVQLKLCKLMNGDYQVASQQNSTLRAVDTLNFKTRRTTKCKLVYGSIDDVFNSPCYTLEELATFLEIKLASKAQLIKLRKKHYEPKPEKRPGPLLEGWEAAYQRTFWDINIKLAPKKHTQMFYRYIYGYRKLDYILENFDLNGKSAAGLHGRIHAKERRRFIELGLIRKISSPDPIEGKAAKYIITTKFINYLSQDDKDYFEAKTKESFKKVKDLDASAIPPHKLREKLPSFYRALRNANYTHEKTQDILMDQLSKRKRFDEQDNLALIAQLGKTFILREDAKLPGNAARF